MKKFCCWFLLLVCGLLSGHARAQRVEVQPDTVLGRVAIREISSDQQGFAWVAARQGMFRYDGRELVPLARLVHSGPPLRGGAYRVVVDSAGTVWAGMQDGLYAFVPATGQLRKVLLPVLRGAHGHINALLLHRGALWIGRGLDPLQVLRLSLRQPSRPARLVWQYPSGHMVGLEADSLGRLLLVSNTHSWRLSYSGRVLPVRGYLPGHRLSKADGSKLLLPAGVPIPLPHGYLALGDSALLEQRPGRPARVLARWRISPTRSRFVPRTDVLELDSTWYWPGDGEVLALSIRRQQAVPVIYRYPVPLAREWDLELRFNRARMGLWAFAVGVAGTVRLRPRPQLVTPLPVAGGQVISTRSINRLPDGRLMVGSYAGTFTQAADSPQAPLRRWSGPPAQDVWFATLRLPDNRLLVALESGPVQLLTGRQTEVLRWQGPHPNPTAQANFCLLQDHAGRLWAGGQAGLFQLDVARRTKARYREADPAWPLHRCEIEAMAEGRPGELWLATNQGLYWLRPATGELRHYGPDEPAPRRLPTRFVRCLAFSSPDSLWVGTQDEGLLLLHPRLGLRQQLTLGRGLPSEAVAFVVAPARGRVLWVGTHKGLVRYEPGTGRRSDLTAENGLSTNEMNRQSVWFDTKNNQLYVGGVGGLSRLSPPDLARPEPRPRLLLTSLTQHHAAGDAIRTEYLSGSLPTGLTLAPGDAFADVLLGLSNYQRPEQARFSYRLLGSANEHWQELGTSPRLRLQGLEPGDYTLEVRAETGLGTLSSNVLRVPVRARTYWWRRPGVWALLALTLAAASGGAAYGWQRRRATRREEQQRAEYELRQRLSADLHDEVGALLTRVTMRAEMLEEEQRTPQLRALLEESRQAATTVRDIIWSVNVAADTIEALTDRFRDLLDQSARATGGEASFKLLPPTPEPGTKLRAQVRQHVYLIGKEAITNCLKHGRRDQHLTVSLGISTAELWLEICNSCQNGTPSRTGQGLRNMASRAATIGGLLSVGADAENQAIWRVVLRVPAPLARD